MSTSTTLENMYSNYGATASIIPYKDWVIVAYDGYKGVGLHIYETMDSLKDFDNYERRFDRITEADQAFQDFGHAVKWAFETLGE